VRIAHLKAKFASYALSPRTQCAQKEKRYDSHEPRCISREHLHLSIRTKAATHGPLHLPREKTHRTAFGTIFLR
jgi:hypothetical protein